MTDFCNWGLYDRDAHYRSYAERYAAESAQYNIDKIRREKRGYGSSSTTPIEKHKDDSSLSTEEANRRLREARFFASLPGGRSGW